MEKTVTYKITELRSGRRDEDEHDITLVKGENERGQIVTFVDFELPSMRLGDELLITVENVSI